MMTHFSPREPRPSYFTLFRKSQQGMTLTELIVGLVIFSIVALFIGVIMSQTQKTYSQMSGRVNQEAEAEEMSAILRHYLSQAIELSAYAGIGGGVSNLTGQILTNYDLGTAWTAATGLSVNPVALFFMDDQASDVATMSAPNRFVPVAILVQRPSEKKYGLVAIQIADSPSQSVLNGANPKFRFTNIVDFKIQNLIYENDAASPPRRKVVSLTIVFTKRFFRDSDIAKHRWCPPAKMTSSGCLTNSFYTDITKTVDVTVRNNVLGPSYAQRKKSPLAAANWFSAESKRPFQGIYFHRPRFPVGALRR